MHARFISLLMSHILRECSSPTFLNQKLKVVRVNIMHINISVA